MTKNEDKILDWRSTGRRKARATLFKSYTSFECVDCGRTSLNPPKDAPPWFEEIWPVENRELQNSLQADHEGKDTQDNSIENLAWRCSSCHKLHDNQTEKGKSTREELDYGL